MNRKLVISGIVLAALAVAIGFFVRPGGGGSNVAGSFPPADIAMGETLYAQSCAVCHGKNLEGQPNWQSAGPDGKLPAPPHDASGHTWHHDDGVLFSYTKLGGRQLLADQGMDFNSGMPAFGDQLSDQEIRNIIGFIKSTWPERQRQEQAERTRFALEQEGN